MEKPVWRSRVDFEQLPYWANIALAARSAARVPLDFVANFTQMSKDDAEVLGNAIEVAARAASVARFVDTTSLQTQMKAVNKRLTKRIVAMTLENNLKMINSHPFVEAVIHLAKAASGPGDAAEVADRVSASLGVMNARGVAVAVIRAVDSDWKRLRDAARENAWNDQSPVVADSLGPTWPDGAPNWSEREDWKTVKPGTELPWTFTPSPTRSKAPAPLPTRSWRERMEDGDDNFTEEAIVEADDAFSSFLAELKQLGPKPSSDQTLPVIKRVVECFNDINRRHGPVVETSEREEICAFLREAWEARGVRFDKDPTEAWREW